MGEGIEDIKTKDRKNPFKKFPGKRIKCNTDKFIEKLWISLQGIIGEEYKLSKSEAKWEKYVDEWAKGYVENKGCFKYYIPVSIFRKISNPKKAAYYRNKVIECFQNEEKYKRLTGGG